MRLEYVLDSETVEMIVTLEDKRDTVLNHVSDALSSKFSVHPDILANLFWVVPTRLHRGQRASTENLGSWVEVGNSLRPRGGIRSLSLASGPTGTGREHIVRFIGDPVTFCKYTVAGRSAICADPNICPVSKKYNIEPVMRHAVNMINRADGLLYLCELPTAALQPVAAWSERRGKNPGSEIAVDFSITVRRVGKCVRYEVDALDPSILTEEEKNLRLYDLKKLFRATPAKEIEERLFGGHRASPLAKQKRGKRM